MNGSFNKVFIFKDKVIKTQSLSDSFSKNIYTKIDSKNYKKYYKDLKKLGIEVATIYVNLNILGKTFQVQEYIKGKTLQEYMEDKEIDIENKLNLLLKLLNIYKKTLESDVCIDLNMQNFIIKENKLIYIDLVPALYKSNIKDEEYSKFYVNNNYVLCNLLSYVLRSLLYLDKEQLKIIKNKVQILIYETLGLKLNLNENTKSFLLNMYLDTDMSKDVYNTHYQRIKRM